MSILRNQVNSKRQGDVGVGMAIGWFLGNGYPVYIPIGDPAHYDLVIQIDYDVFSVQVKTTYYKNPAGNYVANLKVSGGNRSGTGKHSILTQQRSITFSSTPRMVVCISYLLEQSKQNQ